MAVIRSGGNNTPFGASKNNLKLKDTVDPLVEALTTLTDDEVKRLSLELDLLSHKYLDTIQDFNGIKHGVYNKNGTRYFYHTNLHALEMYNDAKLILEPAKKCFPKSTSEAKINLYVKLVQCMGAVHDIIQGEKTPEENEKESCKIFKNDFAEIIKRLSLSNDDPKRYYGGFQKEINSMAEAVIVDGTVFVFKDMRSKAESNFMNEGIPSSGLVCLAQIYIGKNDTSRTTHMELMLKDPDVKEVLAKQYEALKNNKIIGFLPVFDKPAPVFEHLDIGHPGRKVDVLSFMQILGQNIRMAAEFCDAYNLMPHVYSVISEENKSMNLSDHASIAEYEYIKSQIKKEISEDGFSNRMAKVYDVANINAKVKETFAVDKILDESNKDLWKKYVANADKVLQAIEKEERSLKGDALEKFKKDMIQAFADIAYNQTGRFMPKPDVPRTVKSLIGVWERRAEIANANAAKKKRP